MCFFGVKSNLHILPYLAKVSISRGEGRCRPIANIGPRPFSVKPRLSGSFPLLEANVV